MGRRSGRGRAQREAGSMEPPRSQPPARDSRRRQAHATSRAHAASQLPRVSVLEKNEVHAAVGSGNQGRSSRFLTLEEVQGLEGTEPHFREDLPRATPTSEQEDHDVVNEAQQGPEHRIPVVEPLAEEEREGECKSFKEKFMKCLRDNNFENALCRNESKEYLECRMERQLMAQEPLEKLGFGDLIGGKSDKN
uniref:Uncharacterized protein n=1 Tax=Ovis aries TaxID=9940 RepID=A0AC11D7F5_SHEEP